MNAAAATPELVLAALLMLAAALALVGVVWRQRRAAAEQRSRPWRLALLLAAQPLCAALLYLTLLPPAVPVAADALSVATAGTGGFGSDTAHRIVLPEAPASLDGERLPDLATALRRYPGTRRLQVLGHGLEARDRDAARGLTVDYRAPPPRRGLTGLWPPARVVAGGDFVVHGVATGVTGGSVELLDPAGQRVDRVVPGADGRFALQGSARTPGHAGFAVRVLDARRAKVEQVELPLQVQAEAAPRLLVLAGAPNPELKYLRRWAIDSGLRLQTQINTGGGMQLGDAPMALNAASLRDYDLAVIDERAWDALSPGQRAALAESVREGLGLLLRASGPFSPGLRAQWRAWGVSLDAGGDSAVSRLAGEGADEDALRARLGPGSTDAPRTADAAVPELPPLSRRALRLDPSQLQVWLRDSANTPLAGWRELGRGRVAVWTLGDSYRLALAGRGDAHARLWSQALAQVARARAQSQTPTLPAWAWPDERMTICGLGQGARVIAADGTQTALRLDPASGAQRCAGYWPRVAGRHLLRQGDDEWPFSVRAANDAPGLRENELREANLALAAQGAPSAATLAKQTQRGASWPWFLAWLCVAAALWWLERSRYGRRLAASA
ncbi:carboxypeptidase regulatory-like domain-containing protein [Lysobacter silvisoli]|nr:carboxypeptidase regulatory-like domain-containing protein [Lysobacter silvisoli]